MWWSAEVALRRPRSRLSLRTSGSRGEAGTYLYRLDGPPGTVRVRDWPDSLRRPALSFYEWHTPRTRPGGSQARSENHRRGRCAAYSREVQTADRSEERRV